MKTHFRSRRSSILALAAVLSATGATQAANVTWDKGAGTLNWADAVNWSSDKLPKTTDVAQFFAAGISAGDVINAGGNVAIQQLQLGNGTATNDPPNFTLANVPGSKITVSGGGTGNLLAIVKGTATTGVVTIASDLEFNPSVAGVTALTVNSQGTGGSIIVTGSISDAGRGIGLLKDGNKPLTLSGTNTYSGITTIQQNNLILGADAPAGAPGTLGNSASAVGLGNSSTIASQNVGLLTTGAFTIGRDINVYAVLDNSNADTSNVTIGGQSTQTVGSVFSGTITLNHKAVLQSYTTGTEFIDFTGKITGPSGIFKTSSGAIRLSNPTSDYTGDTILRNGTTILATNAPSGSPGALGNSTNAVILGNSATSSTGTITLFTAGPYTIGRDLVVNVTPSTGPVTIGAVPTQTVSSLYSGNLTLNRDVQLQSDTAAGNAVEFSGHITGVGGITKTGGGAVLLSSATGNDYTGTTTVASGTLIIAANAPSGSPGALGSSTNAVIVGSSATPNTATISLLTAGPYTVGRDLTVNVTPSTGPVAIGALPTQTVSSLYSGNLTLNRDVQLRSDTAPGNAVEFSGHITGVGGITKTGSGAVLLSGASGNDYTGATTVTTGTLLINTANTGGGAYTVQAGATFGGTGSITGLLGVDGDAVLAPGASIGSFGVSGDVALNGLLDIELDPAGLGTADLLAVSGALSLSATSRLRFPDSVILDDPAYVFASYGSLSGNFDPANISGIPAGYAVDYAYNGNNQIALVSTGEPANVPEPAAIAPLMLLATALLRRRRRL